MNGNTTNGIVPTVELATNNGYAYPVMPMMGGYGNGGLGYGGDWVWIILLLALFGNNGWGGNGGFFGGNRGFDDGYAWLSNGQKEIMQNTTNGFDTLQLSNQLNSINSGVQGLSTQLCNCCGDVSQQLCNGFAGVNQTVSNGFYNAEISANNRQMADMQQNFNNQLQTLNSFNQVSSQLAQCCCDNRLATCQTQNIVQNEGNATRFADANNTRDIITNATQNTQAILDKLCQLELDNVKSQLEAKNDLIDQLRQENLYARGQASQVAQTADIRANQATTANLLVSELRSCPIPSMPVYGNQAIFTCNGTNGCGCNSNLF